MYCISKVNFVLRQWNSFGELEHCTLSFCMTLEPCFNSSSTTAMWPPAHANDNTVWSWFAVALFTSAPIAHTTNKLLHYNWTAFMTLGLDQTSSSSRMRVIYHNWSATKQRPHPQSVAEISHHPVLSGDRIRQCETSSGSRHKDTDQCL